MIDDRCRRWKWSKKNEANHRFETEMVKGTVSLRGFLRARARHDRGMPVMPAITELRWACPKR
jgi:hypothetical protein